MITEAPESPGTALPVYQPAMAGLSNGGSSTSPVDDSPSFISGAFTDSAGMSIRFGTTVDTGAEGVLSCWRPIAARISPVATAASTQPPRAIASPSGGSPACQAHPDAERGQQRD